MIMRFENLKHHEKVKWFECEIPSFSTKRPAIGCKLGLKITVVHYVYARAELAIGCKLGLKITIKMYLIENKEVTLLV